MHNIVSKFESADMMLCQAYTILFNAINAFRELEEGYNEYAAQFAQSLELIILFHKKVNEKLAWISR